MRLIIWLLFEVSLIIAQERLWVRRFDRGADEYGLCLTLDNTGNAIISGDRVDTLAQEADLLLLKYSPDGDTVWTRIYGNEIKTAYHVVFDHDGNIILAGGSGNDTIELQCWLAKFTPDGRLLWEREYWLGGVDHFTSASVDEQNNLLVVGGTYSYSGGGISNGLIFKYDANGNLLWFKRYNWIWAFWGVTEMLPNGDFFVTGADTAWQMLTARFDSTGDTVWTRRAPWGGNYSQGWAISLDNIGNVLVTGYTVQELEYDWGIIKYSAAGDTIWTRRVDFSSCDWATDIAADTAGNIYVCGNIGTIDTLDYLLAKFTSAGSLIWTAVYDNGYDDRCFGLIIDSAGNLIVTGASHNGADYDVVTIKYSGANGIEQKEAQKIKQGALTNNIITANSALLISIREPADYRIVLYDLTGREVERFYQEHLETGEHRLPIGASLAPGVYLVRIETGSECLTSKVILAQ